MSIRQLIAKLRAWLRRRIPEAPPAPPPEPAPAPPPPAPPAAGAPVKACFLWDNLRATTLDLLAHDPDTQSAILRQHRGWGCNAALIYIHNEHDGPQYGWKTWNPYENGEWLTTLDPLWIRRLDTLFRTAHLEGIQLILCPSPDDAPTCRSIMRARPDCLVPIVHHLYRRYGHAVWGWMLALEPEEYKDAAPAWIAAGRELLAMGAKNVGPHGTTGSTWGISKFPEATIHFHQYGWGRSPANIKAETARVRARIRRPVFALEYSKDGSIPHSKAAFDGGAVGVGGWRP